MSQPIIKQLFTMCQWVHPRKLDWGSAILVDLPIWRSVQGIRRQCWIRIRWQAFNFFPSHFFCFILKTNTCWLLVYWSWRRSRTSAGSTLEILYRPAKFKRVQEVKSKCTIILRFPVKPDCWEMSYNLTEQTLWRRRFIVSKLSCKNLALRRNVSTFASK